MAKWSDFETHPVGTSDRIKELEAQLAGQDYDVHPVEMAARIKELEAQLDQAMWETTHYDEQLKNMCNLFAKAEVKLAKALQLIDDIFSDNALESCGCELCTSYLERRAELKGQNNE